MSAMSEVATNIEGSVIEHEAWDAARKGTGAFLPKTWRNPVSSQKDARQKGFVRSSGIDVRFPQHTFAAGTGSSSKRALPGSAAGGSAFAPAGVASGPSSAFPEFARHSITPPHYTAAPSGSSRDSTLLKMMPPPPPPPPPGLSSGLTAVSTTSSALPGNSPSGAPLLSCSPPAFKEQQQQQEYGMAPGCESPLHAWLSNKAAVTPAAAAAGCSPGRSECHGLSGQLASQMSGVVLAGGSSMDLEMELDGFSAEYAVAAADGSSMAAAGELGSSVMSSTSVRTQLPYVRSGSSNNRSARCISSSRAGPVFGSADDECLNNSWSSSKLLAQQQLPDCLPAPAACVGSYNAVSAPIHALNMGSSAYELEGNLQYMRGSCSRSAARQQHFALNSTASSSPPDHFHSWDSSLAGAGPYAATLAAPRAAGHVFSADENVPGKDASSNPSMLSSQQWVAAVPATAQSSLGQQKQLQLPPAAVRTSSGGSSTSSGGIVSPSIAQRQEAIMQAIDAELYQLLQLRDQLLASKSAVAAGCGSSTSNMTAPAARPASVPKALEPTATAADFWPYSSSASMPGKTDYNTCYVQDQMSGGGSMNLSTHWSAPAASALALDNLQLALAVDAGMPPAGILAAEGVRMQMQGPTAAAAASRATAAAAGSSEGSLQHKAAIRAAAGSKLEQLAAIQAMQNALAEQLLQLLP